MSETRSENIQNAIINDTVSNEVNDMFQQIEKLNAELKRIKDKFDYSIILDHLVNAECKLKDGKMNEFIDLVTPETEASFFEKTNRIEMDIKLIKEKINLFSKIKYDFYTNQINNRQISVNITDSKNIVISSPLSTDSGQFIVGDRNTDE